MNEPASLNARELRDGFGWVVDAGDRVVVLVE
jgi:hypothetical protein